MHRGKMNQILLTNGLPKETATIEMMLYKNTKAMVDLPDSDTDFLNIIMGILQGDTLTQFLFIICLDYLL